MFLGQAVLATILCTAAKTYHQHGIWSTYRVVTWQTACRGSSQVVLSRRWLFLSILIQPCCSKTINL